MIFKSNKNEWGNTSIFPSIMGVSDFTNPIKEFFSPQQRFGEEDIAAIKRYNEEFDRLKATISGNNGLSLALAGNILVSLVISKVISTVYEMAQASDTVGKAARQAADELINSTPKQRSVQNGRV